MNKAYIIVIKEKIIKVYEVEKTGNVLKLSNDINPEDIYYVAESKEQLKQQINKLIDGF